MNKEERQRMEIDIEEIHQNKRQLGFQDFVELLSDDELKRIYSDLLQYCQCGNSKEEDEDICEDCR